MPRSAQQKLTVVPRPHLRLHKRVLITTHLTDEQRTILRSMKAELFPGREVAGAKQIICAIAGKRVEGRRKLAGRLNASLQTILRHLAWLIEAGIVCEEPSTSGGNLRTLVVDWVSLGKLVGYCAGEDHDERSRGSHQSSHQENSSPPKTSGPQREVEPFEGLAEAAAGQWSEAHRPSYCVPSRIPQQPGAEERRHACFGL